MTPSIRHKLALTTPGNAEGCRDCGAKKWLSLLGCRSPTTCDWNRGQSANASDEVLLALARALRLSPTETEHLLDLARPSLMTPTTRSRPEHAHPRAVATLHALDDQPAVLLGRRSDALAWTPTGHAILAPHLPFDADDPRTRPSLPRLLFLDENVRGAYPDWGAEARTYVSYLRFISGKYPDDARLGELVGELCMKDSDFAALWASGQVGACTAGVKHFQHPLVGALTLDFQIWLQADSPDHRIEIYLPADQFSEDALAKLKELVRSSPSVPPGSGGSSGLSGPSGSRESGT